ncbi:hypothetical protein M413DRAFT_449326 [Hebeloma cylindrosporum]|uniref:Uncharacterized protein n=1 Tax=Hebeloma cylindrosporum TaxID=76867 RepID=A0A0C3BXW0_HEBCY|nr:hypothetical protein M413DRAFT_449326 [Hebeloma cylindrosporum h7]
MADESEILVKDWKAVLQKGRELGHALDQFLETFHPDSEGDPISGAPAKGLEYYAELLKDKGDPLDLIVLMESLGKRILPLANLIADKSNSSESQKEAKQSEVQKEVPVLSPEAQAIADGFERLLGGKKDPRMSYGRIPPQHQIGGNK